MAGITTHVLDTDRGRPAADKTGRGTFARGKFAP